MLIVFKMVLLCTIIKYSLEKKEFIPLIPDSKIAVNCCKKEFIINFTTDDMTYKFELFSRIKINIIYLIESMCTDWLQILDE